MIIKTIALFILASIALISCTEINTSKPIESYKYWAGNSNLADVEVLNGKYWQSAHFTKEYIVFLQLKSNKAWWDKFLQENKLTISTSKYAIPANTPSWFKPSSTYVQYKGVSNDCYYFRDELTGINFIYEKQL